MDSRATEKRIAKLVKQELKELGVRSIDELHPDEIDNIASNIAGDLGVEEDDVRYFGDLPR